MEQIILEKCMNISKTERLKESVKGEFEEESSFRQFIDVVENKGYIAITTKNFLAIKIIERKAYVNIEYPSKYDNYFPRREIEHKKDGISKITLENFDSAVAYAHEYAMIASDILATQGGESFACCGRYVECSNAKKCIHPDKLIAVACAYRKNIEQGRIFYGANKNM